MKVLHRCAYYTGAPPGYQPAPCHQWLIDHYDAAIASDPVYFDQLRQLGAKGKIHLFTYNSGTDDYVFNADGTLHPDYLRVKSVADAMGVPIESMYLHWAEDTVVTWWISGTGPSPYPYKLGDRIEMYAGAHQSGGATRQLCSFTPIARPVQTAAMLLIAEQLSPGIRDSSGKLIFPGSQWDGLFLDNCGSVLYNWGDPLVSGGTVAECGLKIGTAAFNAWYWQNVRDWLVEFRSAMRQQSVPKLVMMNVSNSWTDEYCTHPIADLLEAEFVGNPIRDSWPDLRESFRRHSLAYQAGMGISLTCNPALGYPPETWTEMQYAALCFLMTVGSPTSSTHIQDWTGPYNSTPPWPDRVVSPVEQNHQFSLLGDPVGDIHLEGVRGPSSRLQHLWSRPYTRGQVLCRNLEPYNGNTDETWEIPRGPQIAWIKPDGTNDTQSATISIKNGGGAILLRV